MNKKNVLFIMFGLLVGLFIGYVFSTVLISTKVEYVQVPVIQEKDVIKYVYETTTSDTADTDIYKLGLKLSKIDLKMKTEVDFSNSTLMITNDSLIELDDYEGSFKTTNGQIVSTVTGIYGTFIVNEETELLVRILKDNTLNNGYYVAGGISSDSADRQIYNYNDIFIIFQTMISENVSNDKIENIKAANEVKKIVFGEILNFYNE